MIALACGRVLFVGDGPDLPGGDGLGGRTGTRLVLARTCGGGAVPVGAVLVGAVGSGREHVVVVVIVVRLAGCWL